MIKRLLVSIKESILIMNQIERLKKDCLFDSFKFIAGIGKGDWDDA